MELEEISGHVLMVGLPGSRLDSETAERLRRVMPGGIILFARNLVTPEELRDLHEDAVDVLDTLRVVAIDQEGGRVSRLREWVGTTPSAAVMAAAGERASHRVALATASALRALGVNLDFAPVVDLSEPNAPNGIGDRSFGTDPERVASLGGRFLDGLQERGVAGCLKHFPGLGRTCVDSHMELPVCPSDLASLEEADLVPYRRLGPASAAVMVGHGSYPALDPRGGRPATLSRDIVSGLLRGALGFRGLVVSDDLEMGAVAAMDEDGSAAVAAIAAGCDVVLYCHDLEKASRARVAIARRAASDTAFAARLREAAAAVDRFAGRWPAATCDLAAWDEAREELGEAAELAR